MSAELIVTAISAVVSIVAGFWAVARWALAQFEARLDERFAAQERARAEGRHALEERFKQIESRYSTLDSDVRRILIELPRDYVSRADYVRRETLIEAKIDQLRLELQNWMLKRGGAA